MAIPSVALDPTCQKTFPGSPPPVMITAEPTAVIKVVPTWKYHVSLALPVPARVRTPVSWAELENRYTPGPSVLPPRFPTRTVAPDNVATALYAERASASAVEVALPKSSLPVNTPGGNPVIEVPPVPMSPRTSVGPVLVIVEPDRAPYVEAVPRPIYVYF